MKGSINSIESCGTVDGPGIRAVVFFNKCLLRCKYCHNPETWNMQGLNYSSDELVNKLIRFKPYFKRNNGGVTFSGGEPLLQSDFLIDVCKKLKENDIHIALDTSGYGIGNYEEILKNIDLILFDIKDVTEERFKDLTGGKIDRVWEFLEIANKMNKKYWIRQVIVPGVHDNKEFLFELSDYIKNHFKIENIEKIEFLPYHKMGDSKYEKLGINNPYLEKKPMDTNKCNQLYNEFLDIYNVK